MKIIIATPLYPPETGFIANYIKELSERLCDKYKIVIVAYADKSEKIAGTTLITVNKRHPLIIRLLEYTIALFKASRDADVIYAQNAVAVGLPAIIVQFLRGLPTVINFAEDEAWKRATQSNITDKPIDEFLKTPAANFKIRLIMRLQKWVLNRASRVIISSTPLANIIAHAYCVPSAQIIVNYKAPEKPEILPFNTKVIPCQIFTSSRLVKWAGIETIIRAIALLKKDFPDVKLFIAGNGPEKIKLEKFAQEIDIFDHIIFLGYISRAEDWYFLKTSLLYVHNFTHDDLSCAILKNFSAGTPVIAANINANNELIFSERTGILFEPNNETKLAQEIARLFKDETLRARIINDEQKAIAEKFSWDAHILKLHDIFESIRKK